MADFTSNFWSWFIIVPTVIGILAMFWLNRWMAMPPGKGEEKAKPTGHVWDENLEELNNPLPRWWLNMFYITLIFGIGYLVLYPGLGTFAGALGWSSTGQYVREVGDAEKRLAPLYEGYLRENLAKLAADKEALKTGERMFATYCTTCHGADARGSAGFPNLRDGDWLYGGAPETIKASIMGGRNGLMPAWGAALGKEGVFNVSEYVFSLSGKRVTNENAAAAGKQKYMELCVACHGPDGRGNPQLGAPNLTDDVWLYGGTQAAVMETIEKGRAGRWRAHGEFLGEAKSHILAAYVYSLSQPAAKEKR